MPCPDPGGVANLRIRELITSTPSPHGPNSQPNWFQQIRSGSLFVEFIPGVPPASRGRNSPPGSSRLGARREARAAWEAFALAARRFLRGNEMFRKKQFQSPCRDRIEVVALPISTRSSACAPGKAASRGPRLSGPPTLPRMRTADCWSEPSVDAKRFNN